MRDWSLPHQVDFVVGDIEYGMGIAVSCNCGWTSPTLAEGEPWQPHYDGHL